MDFNICHTQHLSLVKLQFKIKMVQIKKIKVFLNTILVFIGGTLKW